MKNGPLYGLVCAGGGAHGAYQVGVLKYIHEHFCRGEQSPFKIFAGSSCGSLNTSFFAAESFQARSSRLWLEELWMDFHVPAYHGNMLKNALISIYREWRKAPSQRDKAWALLDPKPMVDIIVKGFLREHLERSLTAESTLGIAVAATELVSGRACWFQEGAASANWNLFHSIGVIEPITPTHVAASCSVPVFLPPVKIGDRYYLDGSVSLDRPLTAAISMGASKILSIATDKPTVKDLPAYPLGYLPRFSNVIRMLLKRLGRDAAADEAAQINMLNRFYGGLSRKNRQLGRHLPYMPLFHEEALPSHYRPTEIFLFSPSMRIRDTALIDEDGTFPERLSNGKKKFRPRTHRTRFMFHRQFIRQLINLGYEDAALKHEDLKKFFLPAQESRKWSFFFPRNQKAA